MRARVGGILGFSRLCLALLVITRRLPHSRDGSGLSTATRPLRFVGGRQDKTDRRVSSSAGARNSDSEGSGFVARGSPAVLKGRSPTCSQPDIWGGHSAASERFARHRVVGRAVGAEASNVVTSLPIPDHKRGAATSRPRWAIRDRAPNRNPAVAQARSRTRVPFRPRVICAKKRTGSAVVVVGMEKPAGKC